MATYLCIVRHDINPHMRGSITPYFRGKPELTFWVLISPVADKATRAVRIPMPSCLSLLHHTTLLVQHLPARSCDGAGMMSFD